VSLGPGAGDAGTGPRFGVCTFWYNAPGSTTDNKKLEVAYTSSNTDVHAIPVTLSANAAPTFGTDHLVAHFGGAMQFSFGIAANHFVCRINTSGNDSPRMATIPATGNATDADLWVPSTQQQYGCFCTISHDGTIAGYNSAYANWCACLADQTCNFRHHSLTLVPFQEKTAPAIAWVNGLVKTQAVSINWAPRKFFKFKVNANGTIDTLSGDASASDFGATFQCWSYTNNNEYIVGSLQMANYNVTTDSINRAIRAYAPDTGAIWLIHYPTNTWTRILRPLSPVTHNTLLSAPAVWINPIPDGVISPLKGNARVAGVVSAVTARYIVDIRGRIVSRGDNAVPKLVPGIYYRITPQGTMQRMVVGR